MVVVTLDLGVLGGADLVEGALPEIVHVGHHVGLADEGDLTGEPLGLVLVAEALPRTRLAAGLAVLESVA